MTKKKRRPVASTLRRSRTISGALVTFAGTVGGIFSEAVSTAMQAAGEFAALAPMVGLGTALGIETKTLMLALALTGLVISIFARLDDARTGANTK
jgi:uncharacterized iron-regulated membrane protein